MTVWSNLELELSREDARKKSDRISFDCYNLKVRGKKVHCAKGHLLSRARYGVYDLLPILKGVTLGACKDCKDFDGGE